MMFNLSTDKLSTFTRTIISRIRIFWHANWLGIVVLLFATTVFFWPILTRLSSYSPGGDAMFNAWEMRRNQNCILRQGCPDYTDANIFFPHQDTMLYSESQLSAGAITLPLYWLNENPVFAYNLLTIISFFLSGWFMYLLAKHLSRGHELISVLAGLIFEFAPIKIAAIYHLQNLSIFCLPLAVLLVLKYFKRPQRKYLLGLFFALLYVFYASWVQMVFVLTALGVLIGGSLLFRLAKPRLVLVSGGVVLAAALSTLPLAKEYIRFSDSKQAAFKVQEQLIYSSSVADYFIPYSGTLVGKAYYAAEPGAQRNAYNLDSYSYHGITLYALAFATVALAYKWRRNNLAQAKSYRMIIIIFIIGLLGLIFSFGPFLKIAGNVSYANTVDGFQVVVAAPYLLVVKFLPQLQFIRAVGRWSILFLFALCILLALAPDYVGKVKILRKRQKWLWAALAILFIVELAPLHMVPMGNKPYNYNLKIPGVYRFINTRPEINNLIVLRGNHGYPNEPIPTAQAEDILWAGYHNRNIFNGYSGYIPPDYLPTYIEFKDFDMGDIAKMKSLDLRYIVLDKQLSTEKPDLVNNIRKMLKPPLFEDDRYALFKI